MNMIDNEARRRTELDQLWLSKAIPLMSDAFWLNAGYPQAQPPCTPLPSGKHSEPQIHAVGRYFESLHLSLLERETHQVLATNVVFYHERQTLGELDVLYHRRIPNQGPETIHREIAVKYYLCFSGQSEPSDWLGPLKRDRLDLKLDRLIKKQLPLPSIATQLGVWPPALPQPSRHEVLLLGAFFPHWTTPDHRPTGAHPLVDAGFWATSDDFRNDFDGQDWVILVKPWWLSPDQYQFEPPIRREDIAQFVEQSGRPAMVGSLRGRGFVVPSAWPTSRPQGSKTQT